MDLGEKALSSGIRRATVGMWLAWPLVIGIVAAGTYLISQGHDTAGTILVSLALSPVIGAFVLNRLVRPKSETKPPEDAGEKKQNAEQGLTRD